MRALAVGVGTWGLIGGVAFSAAGNTRAGMWCAVAALLGFIVASAKMP